MVNRLIVKLFCGSGLLSTSNSQLNVLDMLNKLCYDTDAEVSHNAIFGLGLVRAGRI